MNTDHSSLLQPQWRNVSRESELAFAQSLPSNFVNWVSLCITIAILFRVEILAAIPTTSLDIGTAKSWPALLFSTYQLGDTKPIGKKRGSCPCSCLTRHDCWWLSPWKISGVQTSWLTWRASGRGFSSQFGDLPNHQAFIVVNPPFFRSPKLRNHHIVGIMLPLF